MTGRVAYSVFSCQNKPASFLSLLLIAAAFSCHSDTRRIEDNNNKLFSLLPSSSTGIGFANNVAYNEELNVYTFRNFYNGGGVGVADINNDGLPDVFFCG